MGKLKLVLIAVILVGVVGYLIYSGLEETTVYYHTVGEVLAGQVHTGEQKAHAESGPYQRCQLHVVREAAGMDEAVEVMRAVMDRRYAARVVAVALTSQGHEVGANAVQRARSAACRSCRTWLAENPL